jgi:hypothetical protein
LYYRKGGGHHAHIDIDGAAEWRGWKSLKFLGLHITGPDTNQSHQQQRLFNLRQLKKFVTDPQILKKFESCTIESILNGRITAWCGNGTALKSGHQTAEQLTLGCLPVQPCTLDTICTLETIYTLETICNLQTSNPYTQTHTQPPINKHTQALPYTRMHTHIQSTLLSYYILFIQMHDQDTTHFVLSSLGTGGSWGEDGS